MGNPPQNISDFSWYGNEIFWSILAHFLKNSIPTKQCDDQEALHLSAGNAKAGMVHSVSGCTRGVQVKL